jgi:hypothetical protein
MWPASTASCAASTFNNFNNSSHSMGGIQISKKLGRVAQIRALRNTLCTSFATCCGSRCSRGLPRGGARVGWGERTVLYPRIYKASLGNEPEGSA